MQRYAERTRRELYVSERFKEWFKWELPDLQPTRFSTGSRPLVEAATILSRYAAGVRLVIEPDEDTPGDLKRLRPHSNAVWELKTGDIRIFGWFHEFDCFVAYVGADATVTKERGYDQPVSTILDFLEASGLRPVAGDHRYVITL